MEWRSGWRAKNILQCKKNWFKRSSSQEVNLFQHSNPNPKSSSKDSKTTPPKKTSTHLPNTSPKTPSLSSYPQGFALIPPFYRLSGPVEPPPAPGRSGNVGVLQLAEAMGKILRVESLQKYIPPSNSWWGLGIKLIILLGSSTLQTSWNWLHHCPFVKSGGL